MELVKARLMSLSIYKNILETPAVAALLRLSEAKTPDGMIESYTDFIYSVYRAGFENLEDYLGWHLKFDESFIGEAVASGTAPASLMAAAAMDIRTLSEVGGLDCGALKATIHDAGVWQNRDYGPIVGNLAELPKGTPFTPEEIFESYRTRGCGMFALGRAFRWEKGELTPVRHPDRIRSEDMIGYELQRRAVAENTRALLRGRPANNVLLYGDSGTGKSATVKSLLNIPEFYNLRLIEIAKNSLDELGQVERLVGSHTQKFILYIDDLSFDQQDKGFSALKTALEGGLERRPDNVAIYATSNRRHMIRERFSDRQGDDVHARETLEEHTSLSERFGIRLSYLALNKRDYTDMVLELCRREGIPMEEEAIRTEANQWELRHGGRTPRVAVQLVEKLAGDAGLRKDPAGEETEA